MSPVRRPRHGYASTATGVGSWRDAAACRDSDVNLFYPPTGKTAGPAQRVCSGCIVRAACLEHALNVGEAHGVWGGKTEEERRAIRRRRREAS